MPKLVQNKLRVYHMAQIPCKPFYAEVRDEYEATKIMEVLADQHLFLFDEKIIPDYSNIIGVEMLSNSGEWGEYWNEEESMEWEEFDHIYISKDKD